MNSRHLLFLLLLLYFGLVDWCVCECVHAIFCMFYNTAVLCDVCKRSKIFISNSRKLQDENKTIDFFPCTEPEQTCIVLTCICMWCVVSHHEMQLL